MLPFILTIRDESDRSLVEDVYLKYGRKIYCIAGNYLKDDRDIEDCVQDVFVMLIDHLEEYRVWQEKHQINFLVKCCRCIAINKYKVTAKRHRKEISVSGAEEDGDLEIEDKDSDVAKPIISEETQRRVHELIETMDPKYGDILYLKGFLGMKNAEIAEMLNMSVDLVNVRLMRARKILLSTKGKELNEICRK